MAASTIRKRQRGNDPAGPGRPRSANADKAILRAALALFIERGLDGVGVEQVADSAGVARTTVYRRWTSREALIAAAIADARGTLDERALRKSTSPAAMAEEVIGALVEIVAAPHYRKIVARLIGAIPDHPNLMSIYWDAYLAPRRKAAARVLDDARRSGLIPHGSDPEILLDLITGAVMHHLLLRRGEGSKAALRAYLIRVFQQLGLVAGGIAQAEPTEGSAT